MLWLQTEPRRALLRYEKAMEPFKYTSDVKDNKEVVAIKELKTSLHLNMAACYEKLQDWGKMHSNSNKALELTPGSVKASFRKAKASVMGHLGDVEVSARARTIHTCSRMSCVV
jgi:hypothetical protein